MRTIADRHIPTYDVRDTWLSALTRGRKRPLNSLCLAATCRNSRATGAHTRPALERLSSPLLRGPRPDQSAGTAQPQARPRSRRAYACLPLSGGRQSHRRSLGRIRPRSGSAPRGQRRRGSQADTRRGRADVPGVWGTIKRGADNLSANLWDLPRPDDPGNSVRCGLEEDRRRDAIAFEVLGCQRRRAPDPQRGTLRRYARTANLRPRSDRLVGHPDRVYLSAVAQG